MAEDFDVEAMLEAPVDFGKKDSGLGSLNGGDTSPSTTHQEKNGTKEYSSERDKERKRHKRRSRSRSRDRKKRSKRSRSREKRRRGERGEKGGNRSSSRSPRSRSRSHSRSQSPLPAAAAARNRSRSRSRSRDRAVESRSGRRSRRSNSRDRRDDRGRRQQRSLSRDRYDRRDLYGGGRRGGGGGGGGGYYDRRSPTPREDLPIEERDQRTVFCMQLAARVRQRDIEEFFSKVGRVREVRLIMDNRTRRHKGIAYVEFKAIDSVGKAIAMTGTRLCGVPIVVQHSQAEKNRLAAANASTKTTAAAGSGLSGLLGARNGGVGGGGAGAAGGPNGPMSLYVGSLHFNITEDMLRGIFEPFGRVEKIELSRDPETGRSKGYGFVHFSLAEDAKKALEQLNGFELAGRAMKVNYVTEKAGDSGWNNGLHGPGAFDSDEIDRGGIELGAAGRLQLMAKLAEGTDIELPKAAMSALQMSSSSGVAVASSNGGSSTLIPPIATQCFLLTNMFDRHHEASASWPEDIRNDVIEECRNHGGVLHVYVDQTSDEGHVYVKCTSIASATATVNALHGRWFAGRLITAAFVPVIHYHNLFPESAVNTTPLSSVDAGGVSI